MSPHRNSESPEKQRSGGSSPRGDHDTSAAAHDMNENNGFDKSATNVVELADLVAEQNGENNGDNYDDKKSRSGSPTPNQDDTAPISSDMARGIGESRSRTRSVDRASRSRSRSRSSRRKRYHHHKRHSKSKSYSDYSRSRSPRERSPKRKRSHGRRSRSGSRSDRDRRDRRGGGRTNDRHDYGRRTRRHSRSRSFSPRPTNSRRGGYNSRSRSPSPFRRRVDPSPCRVLGIFGLSSQTEDRDLRRVFEKYGQVDKIKLVTDPRTGRSRGFAFIYYDLVESAEKAKDRIHGMEIDGCHVRVEYSISNREHNSTPGVYMGRRAPPHGNYDDFGDHSRSRTRSRSYERRTRRSYSRDY